MKYAGFWPRLGASLIDTLVILPIVWLSDWTMSASHAMAIFLLWPLAFIFDIYTIYFVGRWGQTLGKMALGIKIVSLDGSDAGMLRAFYRHSVDLVLSIMISCSTYYALMSISEKEYDSLPDFSKILKMSEFTAEWDILLAVISWIWIVSEFIVLLINKKRRALHDFIAGTVVIHKE